MLKAATDSRGKCCSRAKTDCAKDETHDQKRNTQRAIYIAEATAWTDLTIFTQVLAP